MKLKFTLLLAIALATATTGCQLFSRSKKPKANPAIAADVEANFERRWIERRTTELTGAGTDAAAAKTQAESEFREKFPYLQKTGK
jgi:hypothetical protein